LALNGALLNAVFLSVVLLGSGCSSHPASSASPPSPDPSASPSPGYTATKYPLVLIHGLFGFKQILGTIDYFPGVAAALEEDGARVFVVSASQAAGSIQRAAELLPQLEHIRDVTGAPKLNLIGHSQGSIDARYIAATRPDLVASVTSVGGPHKGSPVADAFLALPGGTAGTQVLADLLRALAGSDEPNDGTAVLEFLQPKNAVAFNVQFPAAVPTSDCGAGEPIVDGIRYYSWGGVAALTNPLDPIDPFIGTFGTLIKGDSDGVVPRCSTHLGEVIRDDYLENHPDEANLVAQLVSPLGPNPKELYRAHANRLKNAGL
jgi:triacylglycerol lipase